MTNQEKIFGLINNNPNLLPTQFKYIDVRRVADQINEGLPEVQKPTTFAGLDYATLRFLQQYCESTTKDFDWQDFIEGDPRKYTNLADVKEVGVFTLKTEFTNKNSSRKKASNEIEESLKLIFQGIENLREKYPGRKFTIDGRLVGDIGEVIAADEYEIVLDKVSQPHHDATTACAKGRRVQIKATFKDSLTFSTTPDYYIGIKLYEDGFFEEIYNGPGQIIRDKYEHRKGIGGVLLSFQIKDLKVLSAKISESEKIPKRLC
jgi:hypothetical protein